MPSIREFSGLLRHTPLHPQWLLGRRRPPTSIYSASGLVLDIGAADRWIKQQLSPGAEYIALDYPATGNAFYAAKPDVFADASCLPFADESVDNIVCLEVIEHLRNPTAALSEIERVLKPGGHAWISIPFMYPIHNEPYDFQRYTEFGLRREARRANLDIVSLRRSHHAIRCSAVLLCLAIAGGVNSAQGAIKAVLLPCAVVMIAIVNAIAWPVSSFWPDWKNLTASYELVLRKKRP